MKEASRNSHPPPTSQQLSPVPIGVICALGRSCPLCPGCSRTTLQQLSPTLSGGQLPLLLLPPGSVHTPAASPPACPISHCPVATKLLKRVSLFAVFAPPTQSQFFPAHPTHRPTENAPVGATSGLQRRQMPPSVLRYHLASFHAVASFPQKCSVALALGRFPLGFPLTPPATLLTFPHSVGVLRGAGLGPPHFSTSLPWWPHPVLRR